MLYNKPTIYNTPTIYKTAGGIYNSCNVYNGPKIFVEIGGRKYTVVKINNQYWTAENLDLKDDNIRIGTIFNEFNFNQPIACYYNNDENTYKYLGLLYNYKSLSVIENYLNDGWRVPTKEDLETLFSFLNNDCYTLKSKSWNGDNKTGFNALPGGYNDDYNPPNGFGGLNIGFWFWTKTPYSSQRAYRGKFSEDNSVNVVDAYFYNKFSVRLVKDV